MEVTELSELLESRDIKPERGNSCDFHDGGGGEPDAEPEDPLIVHFTNEAALGIMAPGGEMLQPLSGFEEPPDDDTAHSTDSTEDVIVQLMDIRTRLSTLRGMLERRLATDLTHYTFWLQDAKELESHKTLVDQCIKGEGVVQVNLQLKPLERRINILDVLKPDEELIDLAPPPDGAETPEEVADGEAVGADGEAGVEVEAEVSAADTVSADLPPAAASPHAPQDNSKQPLHSTMVKWIVDEQFQSDRSRLKMPDEPADWSVAHVRLWIQWAVRQFNLTGIKLPDWSISGEQLCAMSLHEFREKCPSDPGDIFWTHFELLRKCKFIAVIQKEDGGGGAPRAAAGKDTERQYAVKRKKPQPLQQMITEPGDLTEYGGGAGAGTLRGASTGQIHLWQFLLELLTTADHLPVIQWHGTEGEFKLVEPERVARLWGSRKHKPAMNYEKLSRALRYYYDGDMIAKVNGKRFVYKFVCDLRQLVGYSAGELARLVSDTYEQQCGSSALNNTD